MRYDAVEEQWKAKTNWLKLAGIGVLSAGIFGVVAALVLWVCAVWDVAGVGAQLGGTGAISFFAGLAMGLIGSFMIEQSDY